MKIWVGSPTDVRYGYDAKQALHNINDSKYWSNDVGITKVDKDRWLSAQKFESDGWLKHWSDANSDRNDHHKVGFNNYINVPYNLGRVVEIGCGPFTQLQTIIKGRTADSITLLDPLLDQYITLQNCIYKNKVFGNYQNIPLSLICDQAENFNDIEKYDTAVCINVLEHVQDAELILDRLYKCLVPNGIIIFGERYYDGLNIDEVYDIGHPIRIKINVFLEWEKKFGKLYKFISDSDDSLSKEYYLIGQKYNILHH